MKTVINVNRHVIASNKKNGNDAPPLSAKTYCTNIYGKEVIIYGQDGKEAARVVYRPDKPLSCGATVWIETHCETAVI